MEFAQKLMSYLTKHKMTRTTFSKILDVTPCTVSLWTRGKTLPHPRQAIKIEKYTNGEVKVSDCGYIIFENKLVRLGGNGEREQLNLEGESYEI